MAVEVEIGRTKEMKELKELKENDLIKDQVRERQALCKDLGLKYQAAYVGSSIEEAGKFYRQISIEELRFWDEYLPTAYRKNEGEWADYRFDVMPKEVLEEINFAQSLNIFDDIEIWTPEKNQKDPIALGVVGRPGNKTYFFISRWAESLKPLKEIKKDVIAHCMSSHINDWREYTRNIPEKISIFMKSCFEENPYRRITIRGRAFSFHCGHRVFKLNQYLGRDRITEDRYINICPKCGEITYDSYSK